MRSIRRDKSERSGFQAESELQKLPLPETALDKCQQKIR
jgi:hypothetical protein